MAIRQKHAVTLESQPSFDSRSLTSDKNHGNCHGNVPGISPGDETPIAGEIKFGEWGKRAL